MKTFKEWNGLEESTGGIEGYVGRIKNSKKKAYAEALLKWAKDGKKTMPPDGNDFGLGVMGAQSVRFWFDSLGCDIDYDKKALYDIPYKA